MSSAPATPIKVGTARNHPRISSLGMCGPYREAGLRLGQRSMETTCISTKIFKAVNLGVARTSIRLSLVLLKKWFWAFYLVNYHESCVFPLCSGREMLLHCSRRH